MFGSIPNPDNAIRWWQIYKKHIKPHIDNFQYEPPIAQRFQSIFSDIKEGKHPRIVSERISIVLQNELYNHCKHMTSFQYKDFAEEIVLSLLNIFNWNVKVWKDKIIFFKDVYEIWIACEPILDLAKGKEGAFELLLRQIKSVDKIVYFLTDKKYYNDLLDLLNKANICTKKLHFQKIGQKLIEPAVLYRTKLNTFGVYGISHPLMEITESGFYKLKTPLRVDWMKYLQRDDVEAIELKLKSYI